MALIAGVPGGLRAQRDLGDNRCVARLGPDAERRTLVRLELQAGELRDLPLLEQLQLVAQDIARAVRVRAAGNDSTLASVDSILPWRDFREGTGLALRFAPESLTVEATGAVSRWAERLLRPVLDSAAREGLPFVWPRRSPRAPFSASVLVSVPYVDSTGAPFAGARVTGFPVFVLGHPLMMPTYILPPGPRVTFPESVRLLGGEGTIIASFVVDAGGSVQPGSFSDAPPPDLDRYDGRRRKAYDDFVRAVRTAVDSVRFIPARIGGCPVAMRVNQSFTFQLRR
ncbi:MAG: hypothetical protein MUF21_08015 [Gemmatimonadaceae bacterium]|nr:hypothetical protein [Gemmatimonadaceae bacterium]